MYSQSVTIFIIVFIVISLLILFVRYRLNEDVYYTNNKCRDVIINVTHKYLDDNLVTIMNKRKFMGEKAIKREIKALIDTKTNQRVRTYYYNNKEQMNFLIKKIIVSRVDEMR